MPQMCELYFEFEINKVFPIYCKWVYGLLNIAAIFYFLYPLQL